jgi:threonine aldolase
MSQRADFASDNCAGLCPDALSYLLRANAGSAPAYGQDEWTAGAASAIRDLFECNCEVFFVFNGTAANSLAIASLCQPYQAVICHAQAHIETDECSAPGFFSHGVRLLTGAGDNGKLSRLALEGLINGRKDLHFPQVAALSLTQCTELGTVYTPDELETLCELARAHGLSVHMDGARFANAVAALDVSPADLSWRRGVDVLSLGATKIGGGLGEAVVFFDHALARGFDYRCKQAGQLASKMRLLTAPWRGMLETGAFLNNARHANDCAAYMETRLFALTGRSPLFPRQANAVFLRLSERQARSLRQRGWLFALFAGVNAARFMCAWDSRRECIDALVEDIAEVLSEGG